MPRKIPASIIRKLYSKNVDSAFLTLITVKDGSSNVLVRIVDNQTDIVYNGNTFTGTHFTIVLPDDQPDSVPASTVVFSDVNNSFLDLVRNYDELLAEIELVAVKTTGQYFIYQDFASSTLIYSDTTLWDASTTLYGDQKLAPIRYFNEHKETVYETKVGPYNMRLSSASGDAGTTSFQISMDDIGQYRFPNRTFNYTDFPALF